MPKLDRRVRYTKQVIKDSFLELLENNNYEDITVKAVCQKADINRATFYSHYETLSALMEEIEEFSKNNTGLILNVAINYGGRDEIVSAARAAAERVKAGELQPEDITEELFESLTYTADSPPLDLILRPSGEQRISNFLLWQCAYSEFVYMDTLWPDVTPKDLDLAIEEFGRRSRRFGGR